MKATQPETFLTTSEVAHRAGVTPVTVRLWADDGRLPVIRTIGRCAQRLFRCADVDALIAYRQEQEQARHAGTAA